MDIYKDEAPEPKPIYFYTYFFLNILIITVFLDSFTYFYLQKLRTWTMEEEYLLIDGIKKYGIGEWELIRRDFLSEWDIEEIRLKTCRLMGIQNIDKYNGWKGNVDDIMKEFEKNKQIGIEKQLWKHNILVNE
ncbi:hypothetical protein WA158_007114 [Blastocystis sp. Blastoise]